MLSEKIEDIHSSKIYRLLKQGIWLYFFLLIFEGALRKWVLPGLASPLLIVRDPVAFFLIMRSIQAGIYKPNYYVVTAWLISLISLYATLFVGHGNIFVAFYGLRIFVLHFPLIFIIGKIFDKDDVIHLAKISLWIHIGMTILVAVQFFSPQTSWVNRGVGGDLDGSGFSGGSGYFRVPGTFSFTNGLTAFYGFISVFVVHFWIYKDKRISQFLLVIASFCLLAAIPLSMSRSVFFQFTIVFLFMVLTITKKTKLLSKILGIMLMSTVIFYTLSFFSFFQIALNVFIERFKTANESEGGIEGLFLDRFLGGMLGAFSNDFNTEFWGKGIGLGTNAGAKLLTGTQYLFSEGEWGRLIGEMGIVIGIIAILIRLVLVTSMLKNAWEAIREQNYLPWLFCSFVFIAILQGQWAQPTALGFAVFSGGLLLASLKGSREVVRKI
ncbi:hypothetical protein MYP_1287 [Sporocytophaga myxococcoides]|uniref:O-antigen polymerase n=1 Tax=Sporocytophaga myxococcoides TaxID=153721 RepID=A0A098LC89_9BACT|nr:hypothetical protein MYP_1287 [Sporocytophaga myxococcoides]